LSDTSRPPHSPPSPASLDPAQMADALRADAERDDSPSKQAAAHLLTFTALPGRADFARHVELTAGHSAADGRAPRVCAWVRDWDALLADRSVYLTGGAERLLNIAASYAVGRPVDLAACGNGLGTAHARRLLEAVAVGAGMSGFYEIHDGPELARMRDFQAGLTGFDARGGADPRGGG